MSILPEVKLTGSADKIVPFYMAIIGIIALVGIYFLGRSTGVKQAVTLVVPEPIATNKLTYANTQYIAWGDQIYEALNTFFGFSIGSDFSTVAAIMRSLRTNDDCKQLVAAFGKRRRVLVFHDDTLNVWMSEDLSSQELGEVNTILSNNGITYQF